MSRLGAFVAAWVAVLGYGDPAAAAADYDLDASGWNGVGYLLTTATEARVVVEPVTTLDLGRLRPGDVVFWLYPQTALPVADLLAFVEDGGDVIIADDLGTAGPLFAAAGLERLSGPPIAQRRWFENEDGFPIVTPTEDHFLFFNVTELVANHPAALRGEGRPIASFDGAEAHLVVERRIGAGALLAIADPSLFLNEMLRRFYGNKQFAANVMRLYCRQEPCQVRLLLPQSTVTGHYAIGSGRLGPVPRLVERAAAAINDAMLALSVTLAEPPVAALLMLLLAVAAVLLVALVLALWRRPAEAPNLGSGFPAHSPVVVEAIGLAAVRSDADFTTLAGSLADQAEHLIASRAIDGWVGGHRAPPRGETEESLHLLRHAVLRVKRDTASLRSRQPPLISAERFVRLYDDVQIIARFGGARR